MLSALFPAGKKRRGKFLIGDVLGSPGDSLEVVLEGTKAGLWTDRATGDGGDIFNLIAAHLGLDVQLDFPRVLEAAAELAGRAPSAPARQPRKKEMPVDDLGPATAKWDYFDAAGKLIAVVYRYDPPGRKKEFRPWDARRRKMTPPDPRPLYNQPGMLNAAQVVLVEGEKCAQTLIDTGIVATTAMYGANAPVDKTDWSPLSGKAVLIWPDRDKPGWEYATQAAQAILSAGAKSCHILYPPEEAAEGWDAAKGDPAAAVLMVGVNGTGKTTTCGKLARVLLAQDHTVLMGAADTFRAAAADQLTTWGQRVGVEVVRSDREGADPASVAYDAAQEAARAGVDVVLVDTAGRLQNKAGLMDELGKIKRVMDKIAPVGEILLVLDATTGQNGMRQAQVFSEAVGITGIVLTKMDGTAKGGIVVTVQRELGVPVKLVGLGEGADDLAPFDPEGFVDALLG